MEIEKVQIRTDLDALVARVTAIEQRFGSPMEKAYTDPAAPGAAAPATARRKLFEPRLKQAPNSAPAAAPAKATARRKLFASKPKQAPSA